MDVEQILPKIAVALILLGLLLLALKPAYRFFFGREDQLLPFTVIRDGQPVPELGIPYAELLRQQINEVKRIGSWTTADAWASTPLERAYLPIPIQPIDAEIKAYGVDVDKLLSKARRAGSYRSRTRGTLVIHSGKAELWTEQVRRKQKADPPPQSAALRVSWKVPATSPEEALFQLAAYMVHAHSAAVESEYQQHFTTVSEQDFYQYVLARRDLMKAAQAESPGEAEGLRNRARHRLATLIERPKPMQFSYVYRLLAEIAEQEGDTKRAAEYRKRLSALPKQCPVRPLRPGLSVSSASGTEGSIGAFVRDGHGRVYLLGPRHVLATDEPSDARVVLQPSPLSGGTLADKIATFAKEMPASQPKPPAEQPVSPSYLLVLAQLDPGIAVNPEIPVDPENPQIEPGQAPRSDLSKLIGTRVWAFGRTSGWTGGIVQDLDSELEVSFAREERVVKGVIRCTKFSAGGDLGALVVDETGAPVGILVLHTPQASFVAPLHSALEEFGVELLLEAKTSK